MTSPGLAGRLAGAFVRSKLTPLLVLASLLVGGLAVVQLPREEEPQIHVPFFDILVPFPGAGAREVDERVVHVGERRLWEIPGVEYVYSTAEPNMALFIVRFKVGTDPDDAFTRLSAKVSANLDDLAPGAGRPVVKPRSLDDVPILAVTLAGPDPLALRRAAATLRQAVSAIPDVSETTLIGGRRRQFLVHLDPVRLAARRLTPLEVAGLLEAANVRLPAGHTVPDGPAVAVETDGHIRTAEDLRRVVLSVSGGRPVLLRDVARVTDGVDEDETGVLFASGPAGAPQPAVTLAVSKRRGANAAVVSRAALDRIARLRGEALPPGTTLTITRDNGQTAKDKSDELLFHMALATLSVTLLIALALGPREALVVLVAVPVTLALTLFIYYLSGYTLNRITLFALIFSIGILVDDAIVVVENIHRHYALRDGRPLARLAVDAVAEVGNPTLLATWAVIAAIVPMAFVRGLMGPYMRPIPVGASAAMLFSVAVAFIVSPWAFTHLLEFWKPRPAEHAPHETALDKLYRRGMGRLLDHGPSRTAYLAGVVALLAGAILLLPLKRVVVKMLPFDNKDEFDVVLNMPEGASLPQTRSAALDMVAALRALPEARHLTAYMGTAGPYNFNGLVRHYFLRQRPHQANILVNLAPRRDRRRQSHAVAAQARDILAPIARAHGARFQVAEVPPGPPVLSTLVWEIYGPDAARRDAFALELRNLLDQTPGVTDVDSYVPSPQPRDTLALNREKATLNGIPPARVAETVSLALHGRSIGLAHVEDEKEPVDIRLRLPPSLRRDLEPLRTLRLLSRNGALLTLGELTAVRRQTVDPPAYRKNLLPVSYVIADVAGPRESPVYALLDLRPKIARLAEEKGFPARQYFARTPADGNEQAVKWDGEWQITHDVFLDLGLAFALVLVLIYILVVGWFGSFTAPLVIMAPIPLTLVGILPAHWGMGAYFTATSMIGFIAGAGVVVRNSIILVDFIQLRLREGMPLREAVIDAGAVRFRPMLLTAAAVVVGAGVILFDPIFQGLAVSLMAGEVASTFLSRTAVPVLYYLLARRSPR
jgi:multidrug efflux pump subunit AcrB